MPAASVATVVLLAAVNVQRIKRVVDDDDPQAVKKFQPWMSEGRDAKGNRGLFYRDTKGERQKVAGISGEKFTGQMSPKALDAVGLNMPPLHGNCRSTVVPA